MPYSNLPFDWANQFERTIGGGESGYDAQAAADAAYPVPPVPQMVPQSRFQSGLDAASLAVLQQLQNMPQPRGFGAGLAQGFVGGLAQTRAERVAEKKAAFESEQANRAKQVERNAAAKFTAGRDLARRRWDMYREQQRGPRGSSRQMVTLDDGTEVPMTAAIANARAKKAGLIPDRADVSVRPKLDEQTLSYIETVADGIKRGDVNPDPEAYGRDSNVRLALTDAMIRRGLNPMRMAQKYNAEKTFLRSANGTIALRGMRNVVNARESLDYTETLLDESLPLIKRGPVSIFNRASMTAAAEGAYGPEAAASARKLRAQVAAVRFELSNIYMGGTAPTDQAVKKAMDVIDSNWSEAGLRGAIELARRDLGIRVNAIKEVGPISLDERGGVVGEPKSQKTPSIAAPVKSSQTGSEFLKDWYGKARNLRSGSRSDTTGGK